MIYTLGRIIFTFYLNVFNRFSIKGKENIPVSRPLIVCGNHFSDIDVFVIQLLFKDRVTFMAKKQLFSTPIVKHFAKAYGAIPVDRDGNDINSVKAALKILKEDGILGIFPEGTRNKPGKKIVPKHGTAMLAYKTKTSVLPVHIEYKRRLMIFNGIDVIIGKPIPYTELNILSPSSESYQQATNFIMNTVYGLN